MDNILKNWAIGNISEIEPIPSFLGKASFIKTMEGRDYVLKEKSDLAKAEHEAELLRRLSKAGATVATPVATVAGGWYASNDGKAYCLYPKLPGLIEEEHYGGDAAGRAEKYGKSIGFLHTCFLKCDDLNGFKDMRILKQVREWAIPCICEHKGIIDGERIEEIWGEIEAEMEALYSGLPKQLIHRDPHPANMLFDDEALTGFLDFEEVVRGVRIFDPCYCATSLLVSAFPDTEKMSRWLALFRSLLKGYQVFCPLTPGEERALYGILAAIGIIFAAYSLETHAEGAAKCNASVLNWLSENRESIVV